MDTTSIHTLERINGRYTVLRVLGEGAAGIVYQVRDDQTGKVLALKILTDREAFDENTLERFRAEIRTSTRIKHPNLVQAFDWFELNGQLAYTMEFVEGQDLSRLARSRRLSYPEIESVIAQLLQALEALHEHGVVHRDVKLENILLTSNGEVKLADLGLIRRTDATKITQTGVLLGTAQYMPPEYVRGSPYDQKGDIYAVGIVLFELVTGSRRLPGQHGMAALEYLIKSKFEVPKIALTDVPRKFVKLIERATESNPAKRFQSAAEMLAAVKSETGELDRAAPVEIKSRIKLESTGIEGHATLGGSRSGLWRIVIAAAGGAALVLAIGLAAKENPTWIESKGPEIASGHYLGSIELFGKTGFKKPMEIIVADGTLQFVTDYRECSSGKIDLKTGAVECQNSGFQVKWGTPAANSIEGDLVDTLGGKKSHFLVTKH